MVTYLVSTVDQSSVHSGINGTVEMVEVKGLMAAMGHTLGPLQIRGNRKQTLLQHSQGLEIKVIRPKKEQSVNQHKH